MIKTFTLAAGLYAGLALMTAGTRAETTPPAPDKTTAAPAGKTMTDAEKRAKAADCSRQADAQHLHGQKRETFRAECKKKSS